MKEGLPKKVSEAGWRLADFCIGKAAPATALGQVPSRRYQFNCRFNSAIQISRYEIKKELLSGLQFELGEKKNKTTQKNRKVDYNSSLEKKNKTTTKINTLSGKVKRKPITT